MLIVHHWDTDGICSAAKLVNILEPGEFVNMSPPVGDFSFPGRIKDAVDGSEEVYIVDLNLPKEVEDISKDVVFIDHHIQERIDNRHVTQINPLAEGGSVDEYPSCTTVISDHHDDWDLLSALGAVGDVGLKALKHPKVKEQIDSAGLSPDEASRIVSLIDSNYLAVDLDGVEGAVREVLEMKARDMLDHPDWNRKLNDIERTMEDTLSGREEIGRFCYMDFESPYNVISKLARKAVWEMGYDGALVVNRDFHGKGQTYLRASSEAAEGMDMASLISRLKEMGINAGGKREVLGSVYPRERVGEVLDLLRPLIEK